MTKADDTPTPDTSPHRSFATSKAYLVIAIVSFVVLVGLCAFGFYHLEAHEVAALLTQHSLALIGTPLAILVTIILVSAARALDGDIGVSFLGIEFKGAAATLLAWLAVFSVIIFAIRALW